MRIFGSIVILALAACEGAPPTLAEANPTTLRDQSGAIFDWACSDDEQRCKLARIGDDPPLPECAEPEARGFSYSWGRFFELHAICKINENGIAWGSVGGWERLTVCESDDDCPQMLHYDPVDAYECRAGLCQNVDTDRFPADELPGFTTMLMLCTGAMPRYEEFPEDVLAAVEAACPDIGEPCESVPPGCLDPRE